MKKFIVKLKSFFKTKNTNSFLNCLLELLGEKRFNALVSGGHSPKEYLDITSVLMGSTVASVLADVSEKLEMIPLQTLPEGYSFDDEKNLFDFGIAPVKRDGVLIGVASCFPDWIPEKAPQYQQLPTFLMSWSSMSGQDRNNSSENYLEQLIEAVCSINGVSVEFSSGQKEYVVITQDGRRAKGELHAQITETLYKEAKDLLASNQDTIIVNKTTYEIIVDGLSVSYKKTTPKLSLITSEKNFESSEDLEDQVQEIEEENIEQQEALKSKKKKKAVETYVMLCDDNRSFVHIVSKYLTGMGIKTKSFTVAEEAIEFLQTTKKPPSVLVCDLHMPTKNGFDVVRELRARSVGSKVSVITLTSDQDIEAEIALIELGVDVFLRKNEDPRVLAAHVKRLLQKHPGAVLKGPKPKAA